jgi:urease accessory protein
MQDLTVSRTHDAQLWFAKLELGFQAQKEPECTVLHHRKHYGPVRVQKMLWPEKTGFAMPLLCIHLRALRVGIT